MKINPTVIIEEINKSKKYSGIESTLLENIVNHEIKNSKSNSEIIKRVKKHLHQIYLSYNKNVNFDKILKAISNAKDSRDDLVIKESLYFAMQAHASSGERLIFLEDFYKTIFTYTGIPNSICDLACGLNPLFLTYLAYPKTINYHAYEIGQKEVNFLNEVFDLFGYHNAHAYRFNIIESVPQEYHDVTFLLKTVTTIDMQDKKRMRDILALIHSKYIVVSFPTLNLGIIKKNKNLAALHEKRFLEIIERLDFEYKRFEFAGELVFILSSINHKQ